MLRLDINLLQDYTHEFHKTKANFVAIRERENLMGKKININIKIWNSLAF